MAMMALMMMALVYFGWVSQAFLAILEAEKKGWADSGVIRVTITSEDNLARLLYSGMFVAQCLFGFNRVENLPGVG
jgi:hypothetical protein